MTARQMEVSPSTILRWKQASCWHTTKTRKPRWRTSCTPEVLDRLKHFYSTPGHQGTCLVDYKKRSCGSALSVPSLTSLRRCLGLIGFSRKRISNKVLGTVSTEEVLRYAFELNEAGNNRLFVSVDECSFSEKAIPMYGYSAIGTKCGIRSNKGSWKNRSLVLAMASDGTKHYFIQQGSFNRTTFGKFVESMPFPLGTVLILDNCTIHKKLEDVYRSKGYVPLFLPPYAPQFQPVELAFSKVKGHFRQTWPWPMGICTAIQESVETLTPSDHTAFFRHTKRCLENEIFEMVNGGCSVI